MTGEFIAAIGTAFWLGILTSISPCPLASNIAAISFVGKNVSNPTRVFIAGLLYTAGRMLTYLVLGALLVSSILSAPTVSDSLQRYMNIALGPLLILVGMVLLDLISFSLPGFGGSDRLQKRVETSAWGPLVLGAVFALSFCPVSAALFFGSLLPMAVKAESSILLPAIYGVGTGVPVLLFAVLIASGAHRIAAAYDRLTAFEKWARRITGTVFILVGIYYSLTNIWVAF